jgi:hypothetical protein
METDIIIVTDHIEIHPGASSGFSVVRDGSVYGTYSSLDDARQIADDLAAIAGNITRVNIYRHDGEWCYAALEGAEFDHSDTIGCQSDATEAEARTEIAGQFTGAEICRVEDAI